MTTVVWHYMSKKCKLNIACIRTLSHESARICRTCPKLNIPVAGDEEEEYHCEENNRTIPMMMKMQKPAQNSLNLSEGI